VSYVLLIGAKSDIGKAIASEYAKNGYDLYLAARDVSELEAFAKDLEIRYQHKTESIEFDILNMDLHQELYQNLSPQPSGVICVVGYLGDQHKAQINNSEFKQITDTNYTGCASILSVAANALETTGNGFIVAITSVAGERGRKANYIYGSAKAALSTFLSGLRNRLVKANVSVLTVKPGFVNTKMTQGLQLPNHLTAQPEEVAQYVYSAQQANKNIIYVKPIWRWIMMIIKCIPEFIFKKTSI